VRLLADTHALLWALGDPDQLSDAARSALREPSNEVFVSAASVWEIAIQHASGKLRLPAAPADWIPRALERSGFDPLAIEARHALAAGALPSHHHDPFDRMLIAQALTDGLVVVTRDRRFAAYGVAIVET
jgi:PIN domain nuclease of toxin-antitoxin system